MTRASTRPTRRRWSASTSARHPPTAPGSAATARRTGSRPQAAADRDLHSVISGTAPAKHTISVSKTVTSETSPVIQLDGTTGAPLLYTDTLRTDYTSDGRPVRLRRQPLDPSARDGSLRPRGPGTAAGADHADQPGRRPAGRGAASSRPSTVQGLPTVDNGFAGGVRRLAGHRRPGGPGLGLLRSSVPTASRSGSGATLANPEVITDPRPAAGDVHPRGRTTTPAASAQYDWSGDGHLREPDPAQPDRDQGGLAAQLRRQARQRAGDPRGGRRPRRDRRRRQRLQEGQGLSIDPLRDPRSAGDP